MVDEHDLKFLDLYGDSHTPKPYQNPDSDLLDEFLDSSIETATDTKSSHNINEEEEEEELEWLCKDVFPPVETSFSPIAETVPPLNLTKATPAFRVPVKARSVKNRKKRRIVERIVLVNRPQRRRCRHCAAEDTPQWRMGPEGPKTLCNACGVRYKKGRLFPEYRPANSPTFSAELHSNSTRKIMEMRSGSGKRGRPKLTVL